MFQTLHLTAKDFTLTLSCNASTRAAKQAAARRGRGDLRARRQEACGGGGRGDSPVVACQDRRAVSRRRSFAGLTRPHWGHGPCYDVTKAQAVDQQVRRGMIERDHPRSGVSDDGNRALSRPPQICSAQCFCAAGQAGVKIEGRDRSRAAGSSAGRKPRLALQPESCPQQMCCEQRDRPLPAERASQKSICQPERQAAPGRANGESSIATLLLMWRFSSRPDAISDTSRTTASALAILFRIVSAIGAEPSIPFVS